jgi:hypothetical protein
LLGYVHINNSLFEAFVTADDLGGWRGLSIVIDDNIAKKRPNVNKLNWMKN